MQYILTAEQMKRADQRMIQEVGIPSMVLMERAALQTLEAMKEEGIDLSRVLIVCGSGNNGGDGFAIGRLLVEDGYSPDIVFVGNADSRSEETRIQMHVLENMQVKIGNCLPEKEYSAIIDAVFGIGLSREVGGRYKDIIERMNEYSGYKVAVDIASGISADTGKVLGCAFKADLTVTFAYAKAGQIYFPGKSYTGKLSVKPIGIVNPELDVIQNVYFTLDREDIKIKIVPRKPDSNKGTYGKALFITGSKGMSGAAYLSAKAAYYAGTGLVRIYTEENNRAILQQLLPEAVITTYNEKDEDPFGELKSLLDWADVICLGCGLGMSELSKSLVCEVLNYNTKPGVIDADGLNIIAGFDDKKMQKFREKAELYILTPHMKEMSRISGKRMAELKEDRLKSVLEFINAVPAVCVLKDSRTLVMKKKEKYFLNTSGNAAMAKAGAGDVLAGIITGFIAQKMKPFDAAVLSVYLHGLAGDEAKKNCGSYSVLAEDIISGFRRILIELEEK